MDWNDRIRINYKSMIMKPLHNLLTFSVLIACLLLSTTSLMSQNESKFSFGISLGALTTNSIFDNDLASRTESSVSGNFAFDVFYDITDRLQIKTGLIYESYAYSVLDFTPLFPGDLIDGVIDTNRSYNRSDIETTSLLIPIELRYKLLGDVNHLYLSGGPSLNFLLDDNSIHTITVANDELPTSLIEVNSIQINLRLGIGYECNLGPLKLYTAINSFFGLSDFENFEGDAFSKSRLYGVGLSIGLRL